MTLREAALLVIRASVIGSGGETFILDMGDPLKILEVAQDLIILAGYEPRTEIPIVLTGLREGEKLHERLAAADEELVRVGEEKIFLARSSDSVPSGLEERIDALIVAARGGEREEILATMAALVSGFGQPDDESPDEVPGCTE